MPDSTPAHLADSYSTLLDISPVPQTSRPHNNSSCAHKCSFMRQAHAHEKTGRLTCVPAAVASYQLAAAPQACPSTPVTCPDRSPASTPGPLRTLQHLFASVRNPFQANKMTRLAHKTADSTHHALESTFQDITVLQGHYHLLGTICLAQLGLAQLSAPRCRGASWQVLSDLCTPDPGRNCPLLLNCTVPLPLLPFQTPRTPKP